MGGSNGGGTSTPVTSTTSLWAKWITGVEANLDGNVNYLTKYVDLAKVEAEELYEYTDSMNVPIQTYADATLNGANAVLYANGRLSIDNTHERDGLIRLAARGRNGNSVLTKIATLLTNNLNGQPNASLKIDPAYLKQAELLIKNFEEDILPQLNNSAMATNNFGSHGHQVAVAKASEDVLAKFTELGIDVYFKDYLNERSIQDEALSPAIAYGDEEVNNAMLQIKVGQMMREWYQGQLIDTYKIWQNNRQAKILQLEIRGNAISKMMGGTTTTVAPYYQPNILHQIASVAMTGAGAWAMSKAVGNWNNNKQVIEQGVSSLGIDARTSPIFNPAGRGDISRQELVPSRERGKGISTWEVE